MKHWNDKPSRLPDIDRPLDWQDKIVIWGSIATGLACLAIVIWGR